MAICIRADSGFFNPEDPYIYAFNDKTYETMVIPISGKFVKVYTMDQQTINDNLYCLKNGFWKEIPMQLHP